jgi:chemotaxis methyl-accepting protein methylase
MESACRAYAEKHQLPPYHGSAVDFLLAAGLGSGALRDRILQNKTADGRSLKRFMLESRSDFGRYPDEYRSLVAPLENRKAWDNPVRIAVCGVGLNEEPITLAVMLSECARKAGINDQNFEVHVLSEGGSVLTRLKEQGPYPLPYEAANVRAGLERLFPGDVDRILNTYFEGENGYLVPREGLREKIHYHQFKIGQDCTPPQTLRGQCKFLSIHNVLQYIGKADDGGQVDKYAVKESFEALKALVHASGKVSAITSGRVLREVDLLLSVLK